MRREAEPGLWQCLIPSDARDLDSRVADETRFLVASLLGMTKGEFLWGEPSFCSAWTGSFDFAQDRRRPVPTQAMLMDVEFRQSRDGCCS
jgi:hypothetical protein